MKICIIKEIRVVSIVYIVRCSLLFIKVKFIKISFYIKNVVMNIYIVIVF